MAKVYLVGAGCGAISLYTKKALECIEAADCLVYDDLIDKNILQLCQKNCKQVYVGKRAGRHSFKQEQINELLLSLSNQYNYLVRLKGGDVYVFGRGGEEGKFLFEHGIDFEVVPGLSSVTAGLAYAGIPVTHRSLASGFQVYTGKLKDNEKARYDFSKMLDDQITYIFLMAIARLEEIVKGFLMAGKDKFCPVAIISHASFYDQQCLVGTLENIVDKFKNQPLPTPGIIVVGNVVKMRKYLNFYEKLPLFNKRILVTTVGKDHYLSQKLQSLGAKVDEVTCGFIEYLQPRISLNSGYLVFTSKHGVIGFVKAFLAQHHDLRKLANMKIISIGKKTNEELNKFGLNSDIIAKNSSSEDLDVLLKQLGFKKPIYLIKGNQIPKITHYHETISVYRNGKTKIDAIIQEYDYGFFTCASSVQRFKEANDSKIKEFVSIGKHTSKAIEQFYHLKPLESNIASKEAMIQEVLRREKENVLSR